MSDQKRGAMRNLGLVLAVAVATALGGCATLPGEGPRTRDVKAGGAGAAKVEGDFAIVELDYAAVQTVTNTKVAALALLAPAASVAPIDRIGPGDTLAVSIFEPGGVGLFNSNRAAIFGSSSETLPRVTVDPAGDIAIPFGGKVRVEGLTAEEASIAITTALKGKAIDPQVLVTVTENLANSVTVIGEVRAAGRKPISSNNDRLLDVIAAAGGASRPNSDVVVVIVRGGQQVEAPLAAILADASQNVRLAPRDQVRLVHRPRAFSTFGAFARSAQINIENDSLTLAGALSKAGGLNDARANPSQVLLFRFERPEVATALGVKAPPTFKGVPVVYRLNLREPQSFFAASSFEIRGDDLLYVPNADLVEMSKFFEFVQTVTRVVYDVRVATVLDGN